MARTRGGFLPPRRTNPSRAAKSSSPAKTPSKRKPSSSRPNRRNNPPRATKSSSPTVKEAIPQADSSAKSTRRERDFDASPGNSKRLRTRSPEPVPLESMSPPLLLEDVISEGHTEIPRPVHSQQNEIPCPVHGQQNETDRVVPEGNLNDDDEDFDGVNDDFDEVTGGSDHTVPPADVPIGDCGMHEEECDNIGDEFGVDENNQNADEHGEESDNSDYEMLDDDKIPEPLEASDDEETEALRNVEEINAEPGEMLRLGKCFGTAEEFKVAVLRYSLRTRYDIKLYRSQSLRIGAKCNDSEGKCEWRCYAAYEKRKQMMQVKIFVNVHSCVRSGYSRLLKQSSVAWLFEDRLRVNPKMTPKEMAAEIKREYNLIVSDDICARAKSVLARKRRQSHEIHFSRIWDYQAEVLQSNEDSTFVIETIPGPRIGSKQRFLRLYICFRAQRETWKKTCRPILGVDGAFLRWDIKGHLLAAVGRDGDNRIVPLAWAIVEIESDDNWAWFLRLLSVDLDLGDGMGFAIISDKQKGLIKAIHDIIPKAEHRQCARHILHNWKRDSRDMELQRLFWRIARSNNQGEFNANMDALQAYNRVAYESLLQTRPATWSRAFFRLGTYCSDVLNNLCESFNRTIKQARRKPVLELLEEVRRQCMVRNEKRSRIAAKCKTRFTNRAHLEIEKMIKGSQYCTRHMARNNLHEVEMGNQAYRVDMNTKTCGCRVWELTGIPCVHASAVIIGSRLKVEDFVNDCYKTEVWRMTYSDGIGPVQGEMMWPRLNRLGVLPPPWRKGNPGRPSNHSRKKGPYETQSQLSKTRLGRENRIMTCSKCKKDGHNKKTCGNVRVEITKRPRGRPRKLQAPQHQAMPGESEQSQAAGVQTQQSQAAGGSVQQSQGGGNQVQGSQGGGSQVQGSQGGGSRVQGSQGSQGTVEGFIRSVFA